jgi:uncharacterized protein YkwD
MSLARKALMSVVCLLLVVASGGHVAHAQSKGGKAAAAPTAGRAAQDIIRMTNRERAQRGLRALTVDQRCVSAITGHVNDMAKGDFLGHSGSDGRGPNERYRKYNPSSRGAGENVAYNSYGTGESFMRQWLNSSDHRRNILNPTYKGIGVAVRANCPSRGQGKCTYYAGQCFSQ